VFLTVDRKPAADAEGARTAFDGSAWTSYGCERPRR
jgi:hypothetical protein